jgi:hypothetical protein
MNAKKFNDKSQNVQDIIDETEEAMLTNVIPFHNNT